MNNKEHIKADYLFLGYSIPEVHRFIDDIDALKRYGPRHRIVKHNEKTLDWINDLFGKYAFYIALLHILIDLDIVIDRKELSQLLSEGKK